MPHVLRLKNRQGQPFSVKSKSATKAEISIYGSVGASWFEDSISAKQFDEELKKLDSSVNEITVRINSPGGDVFDGITMYNRLVQHKAKIIVHIDGLAASIASIIALAGDEVIIGEGALYMIHLPWTFGFGDRIAFDDITNRLIDVEEQLISIYTKKTKMSRADTKKMLEEETWMDATTAIEKGFVDKQAGESIPVAASLMNFSSQWIKKAPKMENISEQAKFKTVELKNKIEGYLKARS